MNELSILFLHLWSGADQMRIEIIRYLRYDGRKYVDEVAHLLHEILYDFPPMKLFVYSSNENINSVVRELIRYTNSVIYINLIKSFIRKNRGFYIGDKSIAVVKYVDGKQTEFAHAVFHESIHHIYFTSMQHILNEVLASCRYLHSIINDSIIHQKRFEHHVAEYMAHFYTLTYFVWLKKQLGSKELEEMSRLAMLVTIVFTVDHISAILDEADKYGIAKQTYLELINYREYGRIMERYAKYVFRTYPADVHTKYRDLFRDVDALKNWYTAVAYASLNSFPFPT